MRRPLRRPSALRRAVAARALPLCALAGCTSPAEEATVTRVDAVHMVCATATTVRGVDVSVYQGTIDWAAAARGGIEFVIIRHSHGATVDTNFTRNWNGARDAGILHGAYQYFDPWSDPTAQANAIADGLAAVGFGAGDLPPTLDVEQPSGAGDPPLPAPAEYATRVRTWVGVIRRRLGVDPIIYTGGYYWDANVRTDEFADLPLWHAQYFNYPGTIYQFNVAPLPNNACATSVSNAWPRWTFWQFAGGNGRAPGFSGAVDCDVFNGTMAQLRALAAGPSDGGAGGDAAPQADVAVSDATESDAAPDVAVSDAGSDASDAHVGDGSRDDAHMAPGCGCRAPASRGEMPGAGVTIAGAVALAWSTRRRRRA